MNNKEKLKNAIKQDLNFKNYHYEIIEKLEKGEKMKKKNTCKWFLVPICLVVVISGVFF